MGAGNGEPGGLDIGRLLQDQKAPTATDAWVTIANEGETPQQMPWTVALVHILGQIQNRLAEIRDLMQSDGP